MLAKIRNYMLTGFLIVLPLTVSIAVTIWLFVTITDIVLGIMPHELKMNPAMITLVRVCILFGILALFVFVGMVTRLVFIRKLFGLGEKLLIKIPLFNKIYVALKQISQAFLNRDKTLFKRVALIEYPRKGLYSIGFITSQTTGEVQVKTKHDVINVFVPTTPNPTSGILVFVDRKEVIELDMTIEEGMKLVISGGVVTPPYGGIKNG